MMSMERKIGTTQSTHFRSVLSHTACHTMPCYSYYPRQDPRANHDCFVSGRFVSSNIYNFGSVPCHFQLHDAFTVWSLSHDVVLCSSFVNPVPQSPRNWHIHQCFGICTESSGQSLQHPKKPFEPDRFADPDCQSLRWSSASQHHPGLISHLLDPLEKPWNFEFKSDSYAPPTSRPPHQSTSYKFNVEYQQCNTSRM